MNQVRLSGTLCTHVEVGTSERGAALAKGRLKFNPADDSIPFFCVCEVAEELARFELGAQICISGRLLARGVGARVAVAADRVEPVSLHAPDAKRDIEFFQTMRMHAENAQVK